MRDSGSDICTAAAHPLVLRPLIERLEARGTRST